MEQVIRLHGVRVEIVFVPDLLLRCGRLSAPLLQLSPASAQVINQRSDRTPSSGTGGHPPLHHRAQPGNLVHLSYEYAYNSLTSSATDLKPPQYQLSLFSEQRLSSQYHLSSTTSKSGDAASVRHISTPIIKGLQRPPTLLDTRLGSLLRTFHSGQLLASCCHTTLDISKWTESSALQRLSQCFCFSTGSGTRPLGGVQIITPVILTCL